MLILWYYLVALNNSTNLFSKDYVRFDQPPLTAAWQHEQTTPQLSSYFHSNITKTPNWVHKSMWHHLFFLSSRAMPCPFQKALTESRHTHTKKKSTHTESLLCEIIKLLSNFWQRDISSCGSPSIIVRNRFRNEPSGPLNKWPVLSFFSGEDRLWSTKTHKGQGDKYRSICGSYAFILNVLCLKTLF